MSEEFEDLDALDLAIMFHHAYEKLAPDLGYDTKKETRIFQPDSPNGKLMVATCQEILHYFRIPKEKLSEEALLQTLAQAYCIKRNAKKELDADLVMDMAKLVAKRFRIPKAWEDVAKFVRLCVKDSQKELVEALESIMSYLEEDLSTNCCIPEYEQAIKKCQKALAAVEGKDSHVA